LFCGSVAPQAALPLILPEKKESGMPRFFLEDISGENAVIRGEDARHIARALRMQQGEELILCDTRGSDYRCRIARMSADEVEVDVLEKTGSVGETACRLRLYQALPKGDKLEHVVQKATELGVDEIVPVITARCISRPLARSMERKATRLQKIAAEAAKQSGRGCIPAVLPMTGFSEAVREMAADKLALLFYEKSDMPLHEVLGDAAPNSISLMVGSEGGFADYEAAEAAAAGVRLASLGTRILRCETAPVCALSAILYHMGEI